jgi:hypothetical protein
VYINEAGACALYSHEAHRDKARALADSRSGQYYDFHLYRVVDYHWVPANYATNCFHAQVGGESWFSLDLVGYDGGPAPKVRTLGKFRHGGAWWYVLLCTMHRTQGEGPENL